MWQLLIRIAIIKEAGCKPTWNKCLDKHETRTVPTFSSRNLQARSPVQANRLAPT